MVVKSVVWPCNYKAGKQNNVALFYNTDIKEKLNSSKFITLYEKVILGKNWF